MHIQKKKSLALIFNLNAYERKCYQIDNDRVYDQLSILITYINADFF